VGVVCKICTHPEREEIEADLLAGVGPTEVGRRHGVSKYAARRHRDMHLLHRLDPHLLQGDGVAMVGLRGLILTPRRAPKDRGC
jgi:hypothetical protein